MAIAIRPDQIGRDDLIPFRRGTREHFNFIGNRAYISGRNATPLRLDNIGFLAGVLVHVNGVMNLGVAPALTADGPWNLVRRLRLVLNSGVTIFNCSGYGSFLTTWLIKEEFNSSVSGLADVYAAPVVASANNTWSMHHWIAVSANLGLNFEAGLINLQTEELVANIEVDWATEVTAVAPIGTGFTGNADVYAHWFEVPDPREVRFPPLNLVFRTEEDQVTIDRVGDNRYPILRQGTIHQLMHVVRLNSARDSANVTAIRLEFNRGERVYRFPRAQQLWYQAMQYGQDLPTGVFVWDFWSRAQGDVSQGDARDFINTEDVAQTDSIIEVAAGLGGAGTNNLDNIRRFDQVLVQ